MNNRLQIPVDITPTDFEKRVAMWLKSTPQRMRAFRTTHLETIEGSGGEYKIDAVAEFEVLGGAIITVLVECKHYKHPVKRDVVMILEAKLRDTGAHKGIIFSNSGFQSGALKYASARGIATVHIADGRVVYETKSYDAPTTIPPWVPIFDFVGYMVRQIDETRTSYELIDDTRLDALTDWLGAGLDAT